MKLLFKLILVLEISAFAWGFYTKQTDIQKGDYIIGMAVLALAFIILPFFLYTRYKDKKLSQYLFPKDDPKKG